VVETERGLVRRIGLGHGIALYVSAILGAGVLVMPGQVASLAGPASLVSWGLAGAVGVPLAVTFAALARRHPEAGGIATYVRRAFGPTAGGLAGWLYFVAGAVGQSIVPLTGGYYLCEAVGLDGGWAFVIATAVLALATAANLLDVRFGGRVQLALAGGVGLLLALTVVVAVPGMRVARLVPFAPHGWGPVGQGVVVLFDAFAGWEAIAHLAGEFRDPNRDLPRAVATTAVMITVLYLALAAAVVLTGTYGSPEVDHVAIGRLLGDGLGRAASGVAAAAALVISLGTTNAFIAGVSRLAYALARERWLPARVGRLDAAHVPTAAVLTVSGIAAGGLALAAICGWGTQDVVIVPAVLVVAVYLLAGAAGVRLLRGPARVAAVLTVALTCAVLPSVAPHLLIVAVVVVIALAVRAAVARTR
jgi:amino acid efflux transporter